MSILKSYIMLHGDDIEGRLRDSRLRERRARLLFRSALAMLAVCLYLLLRNL